MAHDYRVVVNTGLVYADTITLVPQPRSENRVQAAQREYGADGTVHETGLHIYLQWSALEDFTELQALLDQFDLGGATRNQVTAWLPDLEGVAHLYEGWAIRPQKIQNAMFVRDFQILINRLVQTA